MRLVAADQKKRILAPVAASNLYSLVKYRIMFGNSPKLATFSNAEFAATKLKSSTKFHAGIYEFSFVLFL